MSENAQNSHLSVIKKHFEDKKTENMKIDEWEGVTYYWSPLTVYDRRKIFAVDTENNSPDGGQINVRAIIRKVTNESGDRLFSEMDENVLMHSADPVIISRLANAIMGWAAPTTSSNEVLAEAGND